MDKLMLILVRVMVWLSRRANLVPGVHAVEHRAGDPVRILLVGYNGARNTGADARVDALVKQIRRRFGNSVDITVMTLDESTTSRLFKGAAQLEFSEIFFYDLLKACSSADVILLCEGSTLKSTFANALSLFFCQAAGIARAQNKPCIAYGSEIGSLEPVLQEASKLCGDALFIARSQGSLERCKELGLIGVLGTDTAWDFDSSDYGEEACQLLKGQGWDGKQKLIGVAPINPFFWPVRASLAKRIKGIFAKEDKLRYSAFYYFSWDQDREEAFERYLDGMAQGVRAACERENAMPVIIGMERLDADACQKVADRLGMPSAQVLARDHDAFTISQVLQRLGMLITSRYHAQVLSMGVPVPTISVSMDERLRYIARDMGLDCEILLDVRDSDLGDKLDSAQQLLGDNVDECKRRMTAYRNDSLVVLDQMLDQLQRSIQERYPDWKCEGGNA